MISYSEALKRYAKEFKKRDMGIARSVFNARRLEDDSFNYLLETLKKQMAFVFYNADKLSNFNFLFLASIGSKGELVDLLNNMLKFPSLSKNQKEKILEILNAIDEAEERFNLSGTTSGGSGQLYEKVAPVLEEKDKTEQNRRFLNLLDFSVKVAGNNIKRIEPKEFKNDVGSFSKMSRKELISMFAPEVFYKLNETQIKQLLQATSNDYALSQGAYPCEVKIAGLTSSNGGVTLGEYCPSNQQIEINSRFLSKLEEFRAENNAFAPYQLLSTLIHETQHHVQTTNLNKKNSELSAREKMACFALAEPSSNNYGEYLISADELDARDCALSYLKEAAKNADEAQAIQLASAYAVSKREEESRPKPRVDEKIEQTFASIYGKEANLEKAPYFNDYAYARNDAMRILRGITLERSREVERVLEKRK